MRMFDVCRRSDRRVTLPKPTARFPFVRIEDRDGDKLRAEALRSQRGYLAPYTVQMNEVIKVRTAEDRPWFMTMRPYVDGVSPCPPDALLRTLMSLHADYSTTVADGDQLEKFYRERVIERVVNNYPDLRDVVEKHVPWDLLCDPDRNVEIGAWHGDATVDNAVQTRGGRVVLFDHSPQTTGPPEYDWGKMYASLLFDGPCRVTPKELVTTISTVGTLKVVLVVIAGMIGSHGDPRLCTLLTQCHDEWRPFLDC